MPGSLQFFCGRGETCSVSADDLFHVLARTAVASKYFCRRLRRISVEIFSYMHREKRDSGQIRRCCGEIRCARDPFNFSVTILRDEKKVFARLSVRTLQRNDCGTGIFQNSFINKRNLKLSVIKNSDGTRSRAKFKLTRTPREICFFPFSSRVDLILR